MSQSHPYPNLRYRLFRVLCHAAGAMPLRLMGYLGRILGEILFRTLKSRRKITETNLKLCFPRLSDREISPIVRKHFQAMATSVFTSLIGWSASRERLAKLCRPADQSRWDEIIYSREPTILLAPHFTSLEVLGMSISSQTDAAAMYSPRKNSHLDQFMLDQRRRFGMELFSSRSVSKSFIQAIRKGRVCYYLPDQDPRRRRSVFAPFYGIPTATYSTLGKIARLSGARVIPIMIKLRDDVTGFDVIIDPPLENFPVGDDIADSTTMNRAIERLIERNLTQYYWSHKRFKTRPPGEPSFYG